MGVWVLFLWIVSRNVPSIGLLGSKGLTRTLGPLVPGAIALCGGALGLPPPPEASPRPAVRQDLLRRPRQLGAWTDHVAWMHGRLSFWFLKVLDPRVGEPGKRRRQPERPPETGPASTSPPAPGARRAVCPWPSRCRLARRDEIRADGTAPGS